MKFILNATIKSQAQAVWKGKSVLCGRIQTLSHVLSSCPKALEEGHYTLTTTSSNAIKKILNKINIEYYSVDGDIEGHTKGSTILPDIYVTSKKPDITILELTVPWGER